MSTTAFEILLNRRGDETEVPDGDFRTLIMDVMAYLKDSRGSEVPLPIDGSSELNFDAALPSVEEFFLAIAKALKHWFLIFRNYEVFTIDEDSVSLDEGVYGIYPYLGIGDGGDVIPNVGNQDSEGDASGGELRNFTPYFHELIRATLPVDTEFAGVIELIAQGDYPRYRTYGALLLLIDLVWWGWQTFRGEPDGRGEGDISFVVTQKYGMNQLTFGCAIQLGQQTISLSKPETINGYYPGAITNIKLLDASTLKPKSIAGIEEFFGDKLPTHVVAFTFGGLTENTRVTDIILRFNSELGKNILPLIYSCDQDFKFLNGELALVALRASFSRGNFSLIRRILNDDSATGIDISVTSKSSIGLFFKPQNALEYNMNETSYILQVFSGTRLIGSEYFRHQINLPKATLLDDGEAEFA